MNSVDRTVHSHLARLRGPLPDRVRRLRRWYTGGLWLALSAFALLAGTNVVTGSRASTLGPLGVLVLSWSLRRALDRVARTRSWTHGRRHQGMRGRLSTGAVLAGPEPWAASPADSL